MAEATGVVVGDRHRICHICGQRYIKPVGINIPGGPILFAGSGLGGCNSVTIDAQRLTKGMESCADFGDLMIFTDDVSMTAQTETVVCGAAQLVTVGAGGMHVMTRGAGIERAAVAVLGRGNEVGVLLMVRLRMLVSPQVTGRGVVAAGMVRQVIGAAGTGEEHLASGIQR